MSIKENHFELKVNQKENTSEEDSKNFYDLKTQILMYTVLITFNNLFLRSKGIFLVKPLIFCNLQTSNKIISV